MQYPDMGPAAYGTLLVCWLVAVVPIPLAVVLMKGKSARSGALATLVLVELVSWLPFYLLLCNTQMPWVPIGRVILFASTVACGVILYTVRKTSAKVAVIGGLLLGLLGSGTGYHMGKELCKGADTVLDGEARDTLHAVWRELANCYDKTGKMPTPAGWVQITKKCGFYPNEGFDRSEPYGKFVYTGEPMDPEEERPLVYCQLPDGKGLVLRTRTWVLYTSDEIKVLPGRVSFPAFRASKPEKRVH